MLSRNTFLVFSFISLTLRFIKCLWLITRVQFHFLYRVCLHAPPSTYLSIPHSGSSMLTLLWSCIYCIQSASHESTQVSGQVSVEMICRQLALHSGQIWTLACCTMSTEAKSTEGNIFCLISLKLSWCLGWITFPAIHAVLLRHRLSTQKWYRDSFTEPQY